MANRTSEKGKSIKVPGRRKILAISNIAKFAEMEMRRAD